jgi:succinate dehydrogenase / fumarate reductase, cytochrome b subunit
MTVHLLTNATIFHGPATFQKAVYQIHALGPFLPLVEWMFIFTPILFHGLFGLWIVRKGRANVGTYRYANNLRYTLQRGTGVVALVFILWHVFHMHGWIHADAWMRYVAEPLGGANFRPFSAASTLAQAMQGVVVPALYAVGVAACIFHFANGIWTMGITWGVWTSPGAQRRANWICGVVGVALAANAIAAIYGAIKLDIPQAIATEDTMYEAKVASHEIAPHPRKRAESPDEASPDAVR